MKQTRKTWWLGAAALALLALTGTSEAATSATLNIDVTVSGSKSVQVNAANSSTQTVAWAGVPNQLLVSPSSATVTNNASIFTEKWALSTNATSIDQGSAGSWNLGASTSSVGSDTFGLQAVFGSSNTAVGGCPVAASTDWNQATALPITAALQTYTSTLFADASLNAGGGTPNPDQTAGALNGNMFAGDFRALCWRVIAPSTVDTSIDTQNIQIIVTAQ